MKLGWYLKRLRNMEPAEILHRLGEHGRKLVSKRRDDGWKRYPPRALQLVFPGWREALSGASPAQREAVATAAANALAGHFSALGRDWPARDPRDLFPRDFWRLDPVTGTLWPGAEAHTFAIDFRHEATRGDIKYVWEANRLQPLALLAAHLVLTGEARAKDAIEAAIQSWHAANPPFRGVAWASGIEVALRAISLVVALELAGDRLSGDTRAAVSAILAASGYWLQRFPSRFSSANNHLVAELAGEYLIGRALGHAAQGPRDALVRETALQILPDGTAAEQSPTYGAFTAEMILLCSAAARGAGEPFPAEATQRLEAFADACAWLPALASYGDDDEGRALTPGGERDYVSSVAAAIHGFLGKPGVPAGAEDFRAVFLGTPPTVLSRPTGLRTFPSGGLSVWRGTVRGRVAELVFDHGPLGYLSIAAHGHADALALALHLDGEPVLVDPGTWLYGSGGVWRDWFRSTPAHNTLNIEGASQSVIAGKFNWAHKAVARLGDTRPEPEWSLSAEHDGYLGRFGSAHHRTLSRRADGFLVADRLLGQAREAEIVFQLAGGLRARIEGNAVAVLGGEEPLLRLHFPDRSIAVASGGDRPGEGGWVSQRFGHREPAPRIAWRGTVDAKGVEVVVEVMPNAQGG